MDPTDLESIQSSAQVWIDKGVEITSTFGVNLLVAILIFYIGRMVSRRIANGIETVMTKAGTDAILVGFVKNITYAALLAFVIIAAITKLGVQTTSFIAVIGAAGLAIGLALQGSLANFAAGVLMIMFRPFKVGDFVEAAGISGVVEEISIFTTTLRTGDNKTIIVPNAKVSGDTITNYSTKPTRRVDLVMGVGYDDDLDKVRRVIDEVLAAEDRVLKDPAPTVGILELADSSVNFAVRPWVNSADYWGVYFDLNEAFKKRFDQEGINIPYPQRDLHVYQHSAT